MEKLQDDDEDEDDIWIGIEEVLRVGKVFPAISAITCMYT